MNNDIQRRGFLTRSIGVAAFSALSVRPKTALAVEELKRIRGTKIKIALNSYSFNRPLTAGKMTLDDVIDYCALHDIDGVDTTGYYFPGYPKVPTDEYIYNLKKKAYLNGVTINGTGVRNDFTLPDASKRQGEIQLVKDWIEVARKLGANVIRVFSGRELPKGYTFDQVLEWMIPAFKECADYGKQRGVIVGLQHHDDFLKTADQTIRVVKAVNSDWFSVILDVGSLRQGDPYEEIEKLLPYACTWQIKENVWYGQKSTPIDLTRVRAIIGKVGFRGFLPIEALGQGDPAVVVTAFLEKVRKAMV
jgi:sugar phosphate isomerase/epimerase